MMPIKQSTASRALVFKLVDETDGFTPVTGATPTVVIRKEGGSFATPAGAVTEIAHGFYQVAANATDTNTLGSLLLYATATGARPADMAYLVVANLESDTVAAIAALNNITAAAAATAVRSELATELARIDAAISSRNATTPPSASANATAVRSELATELARIDAAISSRNSTTPPTASAIADAVWDEPTAGHATAGTTGAAIVAAGSAGDPWSASLPGAYGSGTAGKIVGDNLNATISSRSSHSAADVWAVSTRTLSSFGTLVSDVATAVWAAATRTLTAIADSAGVTTLLTRITAAPPTAGAIADAVWDEATSGHATAGTTGAAIIAAAAGGGGGATAADIADAVWDELLSGHVITGSAGAGLAAASASGDPWATVLPGAYGDGTAGSAIGRLNAVPGDGAVIIIPDPTEDEGQCVLYVNTRDIDGEAVAGVRIRVQPRGGPATTAGGMLVGMISRDMVTDVDGFASLIVERPDLLTPADVVTYEVTCARYNLSETIAPAASIFDLASLIA